MQCCYWLLLFVAGMAITVPSLIALIKDFQTYPVVTRSTLVDRTVVEFPGVTFCGLNR